jgi:hypothetical protein
LEIFQFPKAGSTGVSNRAEVNGDGRFEGIS